jgi:AraC-like DNA-binding protein
MNVTTLVLRKFRSYMIRNFLMILLLCTIMVPVCIFYYKNSTDAVIQAQQESLDAAIELFNAQLTMLDFVLEDFNFSPDSILFSLKSEVDSDDHIVLQNIQRSLSTLCAANSLITDIFIVYDNSDTVISQEGCFVALGNISGKERFVKYYNFENENFVNSISIPSMKSHTIYYMNGMKVNCPSWSNAHKVSFIYAKRIGYSISNAYAYLLLDESGIQALFSASDAIVMFYDSNGTKLAEVALGNAPTEMVADFYTLTSISDYKIRAQMALNPSSYNQIIYSTFLTIAIFSLCIIILSLILAAYSAFISCKPIYKVVNSLKDLTPDVLNDREVFNYLLSSFDLIKERRERTKSEIISLQNQMSQFFIDRCLHFPSFALSSGEMVAIENFPQSYIVGYIVFHIDSGRQDEPELHFLAAMIANKLSNELDAILQEMQNFSYVLIIPAVSGHDQQLLKLQKLIESLSVIFEFPLSISISGVFYGIRQLNDAYEDARSIMASNLYVPGIHISDTHAEATSPVRNDVSTLYRAVLDANYPLIRQILSDLLINGYHFINLEHRYAYARTTLILAQHAITKQEECSLPVYSFDIPPNQLFTWLCEFALALCEKIISNNLHQGAAYNKNAIDIQVIDYIRENFISDKLSVSVICDEFDINEKALNRICRNSVGMNVSAYIRQLRMDKASALLRNTDTMVIDVLKECGYNTPNAFYKAFKQMYGKTPSEYREEFKRSL